MKYALALLAVLAAGCNKPTEPAPDTAQSAPVTQQPAPTPAGGGGGGVAPLGSPMAGPAQPMTNTQSVEGAGGGGVGIAAKQFAKDKTSQASSSSADQMAAAAGE